MFAQSRTSDPRAGNVTNGPGAWDCPHCGTPNASKTARWRHVATCPKNPDPTCPFCALHYSPVELPRHVERCPLRDLRTPRANAAHDGERPHDEPKPATPRREAPRVAAKRPPPYPARVPREGPAEGSEEDDDGTTGIQPPTDDTEEAEPAPRLTPSTRRAAAPTKAPPSARPPLPEAPVFMEVDSIPRTVALHANELGWRDWAPVESEPSPAEVAAAKEVMEERGARLLAFAREAHELDLLGRIMPKRRPAPEPEPAAWVRLKETARKRASEGEMAEFEKETAGMTTAQKALVGAFVQPAPEEKPDDYDPWGPLLLGGLAVAAAVLIAKLSEKEEPKPADAAPAHTSALRYRPPYDASRYATPDAYLAEWGHLPPPPPTTAEAGAARVGLDKSSLPQAWRPRA